MKTMETKVEINVGKLLKVVELLAQLATLVIGLLKKSGYGDEARERFQDKVREELEEDEA